MDDYGREGGDEYGREGGDEYGQAGERSWRTGVDKERLYSYTPLLGHGDQDPDRVPISRGFPRGAFFLVILLVVLFGLRLIFIAQYGNPIVGYRMSASYAKKSNTLTITYRRSNNRFNPVGLGLEAWKVEREALQAIKEGKLLPGKKLPDEFAVVLHAPMPKSSFFSTTESSKNVSDLSPEWWAANSKFEWEVSQ